MLRAFAAVGGLTLLSRITGFLRDIATAALLGAGPVADAFFVAFRLPNHFRSLFAEGAFQAAFVPSYTKVSAENGPMMARDYAASVLTLLMIASLTVTLLLIIFPSLALDLLAPGFRADPVRFQSALGYLRVTAAYLGCMSLVAFYSGISATKDVFAPAAAAPILLNLCMIAGLFGLTPLLPDVGWALAIAVMVSGVLQVLVVTGPAFISGDGVLPGPVRPTRELKLFFVRLGPAILGSGVVQISSFADTIISSLLPGGAVSHLYYADRLYQLPYGVIGLALGTIVLPALSRAFANNRPDQANKAFGTALELSLLLGAPVTLVLAIGPQMCVSALFGYGQMSSADVALVAPVVSAYALGLPAGILLRSIVPAFQAQGDTATPVKVAGAVLIVSITLKLLLTRTLGTAGLAAATSVAAWINFTVLAVLLWRRRVLALDPGLLAIGWRLAAASAVAAVALVILLHLPGIPAAFAGRHIVAKAAFLTGIISSMLVVYGGVLLATGYHTVTLIDRARR